MSVREFREDVPVDNEVLYNALRVARLAPSAGNRQAYQVVIVRNAARKRALATAAAHQDWIGHAPVVLVFLADEERSATKYHDRGRHLYAVQDATIAAVYAQLALQAAGLASCWVGAFHEDDVARIVGANINNEYGRVAMDNSEADAPFAYPSQLGATTRTGGGVLRPVALMPVGVAAEHPGRHHRRAIKEFVHHEHVGATMALDGGGCQASSSSSSTKKRRHTLTTNQKADTNK